MAIVSYNPKSQDRPYLPAAGLYGRGQEHEAEVVLFSTSLAKPGSPDAPFEDKNCEKDQYTIWQFRVTYDGAVVFVRSRPQANTLPNMGSRNIPWMTNLGIQPTSVDDQGNPAYDLDSLTGKHCIIKVTAPRADKNDKTIMYSGTVVDVFPAAGAGR